MSHDVIDDMTGGDPRLAKALRTSLCQLADGPPGLLQEMAEAVLRGQLDLRQAAATQIYGDELGSAFGRFWSEYQSMEPEERDRAMGMARSYLDAQE